MIKPLQRRLDFLQGKAYKNSFVNAEIGALIHAIEVLRAVYSDPQLTAQVKKKIWEANG